MRWMPPNLVDRTRQQIRMPLTTEFRPHEDSPYKNLFDKNVVDDRSDYYFFSPYMKEIRRGDTEGTFSDFRASHNLISNSHLMKTGSASGDTAEGAIAGGGVGVAGGHLLASHAIRKVVPKEFEWALHPHLSKMKGKGALIGGALGIAAGAAGGLAGSHKARREGRAAYGAGYGHAVQDIYKEEEQAVQGKQASGIDHAYITDVGSPILPEHVLPSDILGAFHLEHPLAKYQPFIGTALLGGG